MMYKPNSPNYEGFGPPCHPVYCVAQCRSIFLSAKVSEVSWVRSVLTPSSIRVSRVRVTLTVTVRVSRVSVMVSVRDSVK